jgi:hypothetical protein
VFQKQFSVGLFSSMLTQMKKVMLIVIVSSFLTFLSCHAEDQPGKDAQGAGNRYSNGYSNAETSGKIPYSSLSEEDRDILNQGPISTGRYIAGGIVGSVAGFGIGQAIEGRYLPFGLIFTLGEMASTGLLVAGAVDCINSLNVTNQNTLDCHGGTFWPGLIGLAVFRIWEVVDVWAAPPSINRRYRNLAGRVQMTSTRVFATPLAMGGSSGINGGELGVEFRF